MNDNPKPDSSAAFAAVLVEMARQEMEAAMLHHDLARISAIAGWSETADSQKACTAHLAKAEALLAGATCLWGQL